MSERVNVEALSGVPPGRPVQQEIEITPDGKLFIPWITPEATPLVLAIWRDQMPETEFPVQVVTGRIYCG